MAGWSADRGRAAHPTPDWSVIPARYWIVATGLFCLPLTVSDTGGQGRTPMRLDGDARLAANRGWGRSGIRTSALGLGCWAIGGEWQDSTGNPLGWGTVDDEESVRAI